MSRLADRHSLRVVTRGLVVMLRAMAIDGIAVINISLGSVRAALRLHSKEDDGLFILTGADGQSVGVKGIDDATLVFTGARFSLDALEAAKLLRRRFGELLDRHRDSRGIFIYPDVAEPKSTNYDDIIEEVGEGGVFVPLLEASQLGPDLTAMAASMSGALPPEAMAQLAQMAGGALPADAMAQIGELLATEGIGDALLDAARALSGQLEGGLPGGANPEDLMSKAQEVAENLIAKDPERFQELAQRFGGDPDSEGENN